MKKRLLFILFMFVIALYGCEIESKSQDNFEQTFLGIHSEYKKITTDNVLSGNYIDFNIDKESYSKEDQIIFKYSWGEITQTPNYNNITGWDVNVLLFNEYGYCSSIVYHRYFEAQNFEDINIKVDDNDFLKYSNEYTFDLNNNIYNLFYEKAFLSLIITPNSETDEYLDIYLNRKGKIESTDNRKNLFFSKNKVNNINYLVFTTGKKFEENIYMGIGVNSGYHAPINDLPIEGYFIDYNINQDEYLETDTVKVNYSWGDLFLNPRFTTEEWKMDALLYDSKGKYVKTIYTDSFSIQNSNDIKMSIDDSRLITYNNEYSFDLDLDNLNNFSLGYIIFMITSKKNNDFYLNEFINDGKLIKGDFYKPLYFYKNNSGIIFNSNDEWARTHIPVCKSSYLVYDGEEEVNYYIDFSLDKNRIPYLGYGNIQMTYSWGIKIDLPVLDNITGWDVNILLFEKSNYKRTIYSKSFPKQSYENNTIEVDENGNISYKNNSNIKIDCKEIYECDSGFLVIFVSPHELTDKYISNLKNDIYAINSSNYLKKINFDNWNFNFS